MGNASCLKPGDIIGICAPSARFDVSKMNMGINILKDFGYEVKLPEQILQKKRYLAGDDKIRAKVVNQLFSDPGVNGIICARGGFGAMRILPHIDWDIVKANPKPIIGFSDATALLLALVERTGNHVIHGPNLTSLPDASAQTLKLFRKALAGDLKQLCTPGGKAIFSGGCSGILKGGNLATISHLIGTPYQPEFNHCILFIEDTNEPAYKIDRMLSQMHMAGLFKGIKGVVAGSFEKCDNDVYLEQVLSEIFEPYCVPVLYGLDAGHGDINTCLPMGSMVKMDADGLTVSWE